MNPTRNRKADSMVSAGCHLRRFVTAALLTSAAVAAGQNTALDLDGRPVNPLASDPGNVVVLVFVRRDCPVSARYAPVLQQISTQYAGSVRFWLVYPDKSESPETIRK